MTATFFFKHFMLLLMYVPIMNIKTISEFVKRLLRIGIIYYIIIIIYYVIYIIIIIILYYIFLNGYLVAATAD